MTLIDAGPLVALVDAADRHHDRCREVCGSIRDRVSTVWPAFTEAMHLLRRVHEGHDLLWGMVAGLEIGFARLDFGDFPRMRELMRMYRDLPMDLADAALVRVAERDGIRRIFTLDRRGFETYRPYRLGKLQIVP